MQSSNGCGIGPKNPSAVFIRWRMPRQTRAGDVRGNQVHSHKRFLSLRVAAVSIEAYLVSTGGPPRSGPPSARVSVESTVMINDSVPAKDEAQTKPPAWKEIVARYQKPSIPRGV